MCGGKTSSSSRGSAPSLGCVPERAVPRTMRRCHRSDTVVRLAGTSNSGLNCLTKHVLIPNWELLGAGNLSDKLGASWEPVIGSNAGARSLGAPGSLGAKKTAWEQAGSRPYDLRD